MKDELSMVYRADIDGLRMVAVLPVVLYHAGVPGFSGGFVGVDVFFVISGYLITTILWREVATGKFSLLAFYERRARRILPALFFMIACVFLAGAFTLTPVDYVDLSKTAVSTLAFLSNQWLWHAASDYFATDVEYNPLLHTWSLAVEEQFYIVFPLLLAWTFRLAPGRVPTIVAVGTLASFVAAELVVHTSQAASFYFSHLRAWELGLGAILAFRSAPVVAPGWLKEVLAFGGLASIAFAVVAYTRESVFPGASALVPCLGAAAVIVAGEGGSGRVSRVLAWRPFVGLGLISYSLYLWHWPILAYLRNWQGTLDLSLVQSLAAVIASVAMATFSWRFVEHPFRNKVAYNRVRVFWLSGAGVALLGGVAVWIVATSGLDWRFSGSAQAMLAVDEERGTKHCGRRIDDVFCSVHDTARGTDRIDFVVWGDSHANAAIPGFAIAARQLDVAGAAATMNACPPLLEVERADQFSVRPDRACSAFNESVMKALEQRRDAPVVFLVSRWVLNADGTRAPNEGGMRAVLQSIDPASSNVEMSNGDVLRMALRRTIDRISASGRQVIILGDAPEMGWPVAKRMAQAAALGLPMPAAPDLHATRVRETNLNAIVDSVPGAREVYVDLVAQSCTPGCRYALGHQPLYADGNHLSPLGARTVIGPAVLAALSRTKESAHTP